MSLLLGEALDAAGAAFRWIRYTASGKGPFEQKVRAAQVLAGCRPHLPFRERELTSGVRWEIACADVEQAADMIRRLVAAGEGSVFIER